MSSLGCGYDNEKKNLVISPSLFMRLLEFAKEDAADDVALHQVFEKIMAFNDGHNPLTIEVYDCLVKDATGSTLPKKEEEKEYYDVSDFECIEDTTDDNLTNAYELGAKQAENGMDLSNDLYRHAADMITCDKDNGLGASNAEIEQFAKGYENCGEEKKVDSEFADYIQNIHDSYYEGGIDGEKVKQCINDYCYDESMDNMYDYEGGAHCCHEAAPINYDDIETYYKSFGNECPMQQAHYEWCPEDNCADASIARNENPCEIDMSQYEGQPTTFTINCEDGTITDTSCAQPCTEVLPVEVEDEMNAIIKLAKG